MLINKFNLILSINSKITQLILYVRSVYLKANKFCYQNLSGPSLWRKFISVAKVHLYGEGPPLWRRSNGQNAQKTDRLHMKDDNLLQKIIPSINFQ